MIYWKNSLQNEKSEDEMMYDQVGQKEFEN